MKTKKRNFLKNKKIKEIKNQLGIYENIIPKKSQVEYIKVEDMPDIYLIDGEPLLMQTEDKIIPTLKAILNQKTIENKLCNKRSRHHVTRNSRCTRHNYRR